MNVDLPPLCLHCGLKGRIFDVEHEQPFDLGKDLLVAEHCAADRACRASGYTRAAPLAQRGVNFRHHPIFVKGDGVKRA
jgi:hypothetical protein